MKNHHPCFFKLLRISWLLLLCASFSGCLLSSHFACGRAAPLPDGKNLLTIEQRNDFVKHEELAGRICFDETGFYFLRGSANHMSICRAVKPGDCETLFTSFYDADEIACWGDKLVILGRLDSENYRNDLFVLNKANSGQNSLRVYPYEPEKTIEMPDGSEWHINAWLPLLRLVFNKETSDVPFETLLAQQVGYASDYSLPRERWEYLFHVIGQSIEEEYTILRLQDRYAMKAGSWIYSFRYKEKENKYEMRNSYFIPDSTKGSEEIPYSSDPYYDLCMYGSFPYFINTDYTDYRDDYSPTYVRPTAESGKFGRELDVGEGYFLRKRYPGEQGRMQYLVFTLYDQEPTQNYNDKYDLQFLSGQKYSPSILRPCSRLKSLRFPRRASRSVCERGGRVHLAAGGMPRVLHPMGGGACYRKRRHPLCTALRNATGRGGKRRLQRLVRGSGR
jgi:hypothetical protein